MENKFVDISEIPKSPSQTRIDGFRVLNSILATKYKQKSNIDNISCSKCGKEIHLGDRIHINTNTTKLYHIECWKSLFI